MKRPRFGRIRIPARLTQRWRARLRAQRRWWRARRRSETKTEVLFPPAGRGMVAVETLAAGARGGSGPRIAILHASAGSGHRSAAKALAAAIVQRSPPATVRELDTLVFASRLYRGTYAASYNAMAARAPALWGALYHSWALAPVYRGTAPVRLAVDRLNLRRLVRVFEREPCDAVVCTHFLPIEALSPSRAHGRLRVPLYCVITDFGAHPFWAFPHVDRYFVASDEVATELVGLGVPEKRIEVSGIPVDPRFATLIGAEAARERFGLDGGRPVVLVMGGGHGVGPLSDLADRLASLEAGPHVLVVCGSNRRLREQVDQLPAGRTGRIRTFGFTPDVDGLLEAADVVVSKAGGLTCSEALVKRAPLVIFKPTPGQEVRNARYLEQGGAAVHADSVEEVEATVREWLSDPAARERVRQAASRLARPHAAETIAERVLEAIPAAARRSA
ncbi:MAG: glycosyltransferase [Candidatus Eisenbacteria bacterium]|uniref:Glycosyltransferase n=1 Tax=Eiseniibacteriota bacterium TaxID=2212470 RepID=A0A538TML2_UNCEI|nr:MAG: glycosyltransferase [Candidatus Eisenbacteria bacterium]